VTTESPLWFKSSYSDNGGACIEVCGDFATSHGMVPVRDSKNPSGPVLDVSTGAFASFVASVKGGKIGTV
jgi:hypothetical protein